MTWLDFGGQRSTTGSRQHLGVVGPSSSYETSLSAILACPPLPAPPTPAIRRSAPVVRPRPPPVPDPRLSDRPRKSRCWPNRFTIRLLYIDHFSLWSAHCSLLYKILHFMLHKSLDANDSKASHRKSFQIAVEHIQLFEFVSVYGWTVCNPQRFPLLYAENRPYLKTTDSKPSCNTLRIS